MFIWYPVCSQLISGRQLVTVVEKAGSGVGLCESSVLPLMCDLGQIPLPLCAAVSIFVTVG